MAKQIIKTVIQFRRATAAEWEANKTVIPAAGEPCFVIDQNILKIGDGETTFENLEPINGVQVEIAADGKSVVMEENTFKLMGFDGAEIGAQPRVAADGTLEWIVPSTETLEGLQSTVAGMQSDIKTLQDIVGTTTGEDPLITRVQTLEGAVDILNGDSTIEGSVKKVVADEINAWADIVTDNGKIDTIKELIDYVAEHDDVATKMASDITILQALVGENSVKDQISSAIAEAGHMAETKAVSMFEQKKYEVTGVPTGTLVDYREKEIRVMVPVNTAWTKQTVGAGGDSNTHYMTFKTYAPNDNAVGYIEHLNGEADKEILTSFSTDEHGRRYQPTWLALAKYDEASDTWTYYGKNSTKDKYIGFDYQIDWYDANGMIISSDKIRINLTNEDCHNEIKPFYMTGVTVNAVEGISLNGTLLDMVDKKVDIPLGAGLKGSDEIEIEEDGTMRIKAMTWDKLMEGENEIIMDGGGAI